MKLLSFVRPDGTATAGRLDDDHRIVDLGRPLRTLLADPVPEGRPHGADVFDLEEVTLLPVVPDPSKIIAAPVNYRDHQAEMNEAYHIDALGIFLKAPSSVLAHQGTIRLPYTDRRFDQEGELALVVGRPGRDIAVDDALGHVAGYTCLLDITMRGGEDRSTRKSFDTFTPVGPCLVTPDETGPPEALTLRTWVGDELRQDADLKDLIWSVPRLIAYASSVMTLRTGDIITTGTPAGVGTLADGDRVTVDIGGVGRLETTVSSQGAVPCPTGGAHRGPVPPRTVTPVRVPPDLRLVRGVTGKEGKEGKAHST
ncbi:fumarylacetoacetate hydrolase family protein [Streptomyces phaeolivaceus]|uniref:Fumarylacetoacetate hydrolase family protein n=1 Tax=Streptomyces phaeolivaceus TaxID=2653200 RepID=A0A5P8JWR4_9ACTN|nr:fumarylacetoacetate hydrolase family protein [Streptomyces phaeolivaceus]QFQ94942.1 fumarylacetoacetate hydrolase family protein [Streptomyces phaeolivaceus]